MPISVILSLTVVEILIVSIHLAVYATAAAAFGTHSAALETIFILLAFTFFTASVLGHFRRGKLVDWYYRAAAYWFGLVMFFFAAAFMFFVITAIAYHFNYYISPALVGGVLFGAWFLIHLYGTYESGKVGVKNISVTLPGLPAGWRGKKIVFFSDIHLGNIWQEKFAAKITKKVQAANPEAIFIGGDIYDGVMCDVEGVVQPFRALKAPRGVYFITGNHEYYLRPDQLSKGLATLKNLGIRVLDNEKVSIGGITLIGVDDKTTGKEEDFRKVLEKMAVPKGEPTILLKHQPTHLETARDAGIALGFFGHTHQGQIFPLNYVTRSIYKGFDYGLKRLGAMQTYTSSGVGTWGPPLRLGTRSEIVIVELL
jgi:predicted MPP superfamily phosphohydrolase